MKKWSQRSGKANILIRENQLDEEDGDYGRST
jgi:hypothetical protein